MHKRYFLQLVTLGLMLLTAEFAAAAEHQEVEKYLADDVVAVAYVDLSKIDTLGILEWASELGGVPAGESTDIALQMQQRVDEFVDFGVQYAYLLFRVADIEHGGPRWVVPVDDVNSAKTVLGLIMSGQPGSTELDATARPPGLPEYWQIVDGTLIGGTTVEQLKQTVQTLPESPRDFSEAWSALGQGACGLIVFGDKDSRRVVREMFPKLPEPFAAVDGALIADGLEWGGISIDLPPELGVEITIEAADEPTAASVGQAVTGGLGMLNLLPQVHKYLQEEDLGMLVTAFSPQVEGTQVRIDLEDVTGNVDRLTKIVGPPIRKARQAAQRKARMNQFKNIGLAFHNYANRKKERFPAAASYDDEGKPLLSWRVHILPYIEQNALYNQFHLDEPWDSEHNRKLISIMPSLYIDPDPALRKLPTKGLTTFVVPVGEGTMFDGPQGVTFKDIMDGTSNTIMFVEVVPERAVVWTKPEDWEVDFDDPFAGVQRDDGEDFCTGWADAHARMISNDVEPWKMRAWLTRDGGEIVDTKASLAR